MPRRNPKGEEHAIDKPQTFTDKILEEVGLEELPFWLADIFAIRRVADLRSMAQHHIPTKTIELVHCEPREIGNFEKPTYVSVYCEILENGSEPKDEVDLVDASGVRYTWERGRNNGATACRVCTGKTSLHLREHRGIKGRSKEHVRYSVEPVGTA